MSQISKKSIVLLACTGLLFYLIFLLFIRIDIEKVLVLLSRAKTEYLLLALFFDINFIAFYALAWHFLVKAVAKRVKLRDSMLAVIMGWLGDMLIPAAFITGEVIRLYYINKKYRARYSSLAATVVIHRLLSAIAFVLYIFLGAFFLAFQRVFVAPTVFKEMIFISLLAGGFAVLLLSFILNPELLSKLMTIASKYIIRFLEKAGLEKYSGDVLSGVESFKNSILLVKANINLILLSFFLLMVQWACGIMVPYNVFHSLNCNVGFWLLSLAYPLYGVIDNIPLGIPVNAGLLDTAMITTFILLGIEKNTAVAATLVTRFITVVFEAILTSSISLTFGIRSILVELKK
ncbi:MAG: hypothetical protein DRJ51_06005 [Thermoprotei archaeon]|nr:MAG: hypothetical protein DRJ51_06005 [Thermoprotei archaeon]RLF02434.1 MAG: hypothetical protein DRJ59_03610 [Thermoprotei archaeon]